MGILSKLAGNRPGRRDFALPDKRMYLISDVAQAKAALARVAKYGTAGEKKAVREAVQKRYPNLGVV